MAAAVGAGGVDAIAVFGLAAAAPLRVVGWAAGAVDVELGPQAADSEVPATTSPSVRSSCRREYARPVKSVELIAV